MILNIKKRLQINFTFSFYFLNVATRKFQTTSVPCIISVCTSSALEPVGSVPMWSCFPTAQRAKNTGRW